MEVSGDDIADAVLKSFDALPPKRKPQVRSDGAREWVPLSGIVAQGRDSLTCLATATGMKCLPQSKIPRAQGIVLHDWHAEILAIRSFNRFLLEECHALALSKKQSSEYIRFRSPHERTELHFQPFALNDGIDLHMYCSEAPCGDASMELTMAAQEDDTPWEFNQPSPDTHPLPFNKSNPQDPLTAALSPQEPLLHGRSYFSALGITRRKPSRPDAPPTLSKSCSDKLALKQCTSLLSSLTSLLISPSNCYIKYLILPSSQHNPTSCSRAFGFSSQQNGRMHNLVSKTNNQLRDWQNGYHFKPFDVISTSREFMYSRRRRGAGATDVAPRLVPSNISASWTANGKAETLIAGVLQGRKQFHVKGASRVCKKRIWGLAVEVAGLVGGGSVVWSAAGAGAGAGAGGFEKIQEALSGKTYEDVKNSPLLERRRSVKHEVRDVALMGWTRNEGGEGFEFEAETES